jgi:hypothetical protein
LGEQAIAFALTIQVLRQGLGLDFLQLIQCHLHEIATEIAELGGELSFEIECGGRRDGVGEEREDESDDLQAVVGDEFEDAAVRVGGNWCERGQKAGENRRVVHDRVRAGGGW